LAQETEPNVESREEVSDIEHVKQRMDMLDRRLDDIDSMITAVAERVMKQPITFDIICPHCGKNIEIAIIGSEKPGK
jgi:tRNA(Ser,Leu) C12 N-acetylase TAN1